MSTENTFLFKYALQSFVTHGDDGDASVFTICAREGETMVGHAKSLIANNFGPLAEIRIV